MAPKTYFSLAVEQCSTGVIKCGAITDIDQLKANLAVNCIPFEVTTMDYTEYENFLEERRKLMAKKIKDYYYAL